MPATTDRITKTPGVCGGDACIRGHRIPVWVLVGYRRLKKSDADLLRDYPSLTPADLEAAWEYTAAHLDEIDRAIQPQLAHEQLKVFADGPIADNNEARLCDRASHARQSGYGEIESFLAHQPTQAKNGRRIEGKRRVLAKWPGNAVVNARRLGRYFRNSGARGVQYKLRNGHDPVGLNEHAS